MELPCESTGKPIPSVSWLKDNKTVIGGHILANGSLVIEEFEEKDEGLYHCTVSNELGRMRGLEALILSKNANPKTDVFI